MNESLLTIFTVISSLALGAGITYAILRRQRQRTLEQGRTEGASESTVLQERLIGRDTQLAELKQIAAQKEAEIRALQHQVTDLTSQIAEHKAHRKAEAQSAAEKTALLKKAEEKLVSVFKALSAESLKSSNQTFLELANATFEKLQEGARGDLEKRQQAIGELVKPLSESLGKVDEKIQTLEKARAGAYAGLNEQLKNLMHSQANLQTETARLVQALRTPNTRGQWGELQLKRAVEFAGMLEYCDFIQQENTNTPDGNLRPDMVVRLPNGRNIVVDAKAPLQAYLDAIQKKESAERVGALRKHARHIRDHITRLNSRSYWKQFEPTPEFVVLFLPGEAFFSAALEHDPGLIEFGINEKVIIATPTTLIALLKAVAYGWQQEKITEHAKQISELGRELYDRVTTLAKHFANLGKNLEKSVDAYNSTVRSIESRVLVTTRKFKQLGAGSDKEIKPLGLVEKIPLPPREEELNLPETDSK